MKKYTFCFLFITICFLALMNPLYIQSQGGLQRPHLSNSVPPIDDKRIPKPFPGPSSPPSAMPPVQSEPSVPPAQPQPPPWWHGKQDCGYKSSCYNWNVRDEVEAGKKFNPPPEPPAPSVMTEKRYFSPGGGFERMKPPNYDDSRQIKNKNEDDIDWYNMMSDAWR